MPGSYELLVFCVSSPMVSDFPENCGVIWIRRNASSKANNNKNYEPHHRSQEGHPCNSTLFCFFVLSFTKKAPTIHTNFQLYATLIHDPTRATVTYILKYPKSYVFSKTKNKSSVGRGTYLSELYQKGLVKWPVSTKVITKGGRCLACLSPALFRTLVFSSSEK